MRWDSGGKSEVTLTLAQRLSELMNAKGIGRNKLASMVGVSRASVSHWTSGKNELSGENLLKVCDVLDVSPAYLAGYEETPEVNPADIASALNAAKAAREELDRAISALEKIGLTGTTRPTRLYLAADGGKINGPDRVAESLDKNTAYTVDGEEYGKGTDLGDSG